MSPSPAPPLVFAFTEGRLWLREDDLEPPELELFGPNADGLVPTLLGTWRGHSCHALTVARAPAGLVAVGLREVFARVEDPELVAMAARASQTLDWWRDHRFCGRCSAPTRLADRDRARVCTSCGALFFPRITPAVITLVHRHHRGRTQVLLAGDHRFRTGFYALLAGFVEPGETLEQAVAREVREEVGLAVGEIRYRGSQCWPFPSQLMAGFWADYADGEIRIQESELRDARWFDLEALPDPADRPPQFSIAGRLIESFQLERTAGAKAQSGSTVSAARQQYQAAADR
ncbi:MAG: NAD(+) diphosphatase [Candidatus Dormibacteraeota bacterium]|nr:NAD(+) diphosphatase [Candidatus Dormibacteraeota bacterium]